MGNCKEKNDIIKGIREARTRKDKIQAEYEKIQTEYEKKLLIIRGQNDFTITLC